VLTLGAWLGGMIGGWGRYRFAGWVYARAGTAFPWGTLAVNMTGSLLVGQLLPSVERVRHLPFVTGFVMVGVLGAFTTFSTFAYETLMLLEEGDRTRAALYAAASLVIGLASIAAGLAIGSRFS
jgi:fluoride exporter